MIHLDAASPLTPHRARQYERVLSHKGRAGRLLPALKTAFAGMTHRLGERAAILR
ncbi:MAG: hypothetical protein WED13_00975 [Methyloceanibacter sp.]